MYLSSGGKIVEQPFIIKLGMSSGPEDLERLRRFIVIRMSDSDMGGMCKRSLIRNSQW